MNVSLSYSAANRCLYPTRPYLRVLLMDPKRPCRRTRNVCIHCQQNLGYTALRRHRNLPHLYCPGYATSTMSSDSDSSDSTFTLDEPFPKGCNESTSCEQESIPHSPILCSSSSESEASEDSESGPEVWDDCSENECDLAESQNTPGDRNLHFFMCLFLTFFQLCYRISDKARSHLLLFISSILHHISSHVKNSPYLDTLANSFPTTLYSLRKDLKQKACYTTYAVCPRCHSLYKESQCVPVRDLSDESSPKCAHIQFPNHPQRAHRKKCGTDLLKKVKVGQKYKFVPRKVYVYYSIIDTLQRLLSRPNFLEQCEEWRQLCSNVPHGYLTDVFDGRLWLDWARQENTSFLDTPGNLLFMLNVDWFQPFLHTQYSVGVIYLVIQNLPRAVRFKPENVIIVSTIPGPKEPDYNHLNPYFETHG